MSGGFLFGIDFCVIFPDPTTFPFSRCFGKTPLLAPRGYSRFTGLLQERSVTSLLFYTMRYDEPLVDDRWTLFECG